MSTPLLRKSDATVAFGLPTYNGEKYIEKALNSLLSQKFESFVIVAADDASNDATFSILQRYSKKDSRIICIRNEDRLGMIANWRNVFTIAKSVAPNLEYFAWASDHDVWHPEWLNFGLSVMHENKDISLWYPFCKYINNDGAVQPKYKKVLKFNNTDIDSPEKRFTDAPIRVRGAGNMVYGLFRTSALENSGILRDVLLPDRLLIFEVCLSGKLYQTQKTLWYRRQEKNSTIERQRRTLFVNNAPWVTKLPWPIQFFLVAFQSHVWNKGPIDTINRRKMAYLLLVMLVSEWKNYRQKKRKWAEESRATATGLTREADSPEPT